ncbi:hypothetical protein K466DRAFT_241949 [Polyporus arcularius HHB13444]|uniref:Uncharacterized protein n=1 Tax=Polyporus arcularius HHB13444 TaxID=1314778 RepID=A0A5C3PDJ5_9APHY|nr:hypothetical protein K466DRAFT_241949 [Polyporus arcularius HHB13444]
MVLLLWNPVPGQESWRFRQIALKRSHLGRQSCPSAVGCGFSVPRTVRYCTALCESNKRTRLARDLLKRVRLLVSMLLGSTVLTFPASMELTPGSRQRALLPRETVPPSMLRRIPVRGRSEGTLRSCQTRSRRTLGQGRSSATPVHECGMCCCARALVSVSSKHDGRGATLVWNT